MGELLSYGTLIGGDAFNPVAERRLDDTRIAHEALGKLLDAAPAACSPGAASGPGQNWHKTCTIVNKFHGVQRMDISRKLPRISLILLLIGQ